MAATPTLSPVNAHLHTRALTGFGSTPSSADTSTALRPSAHASLASPHPLLRLRGPSVTPATTRSPVRQLDQGRSSTVRPFSVRAAASGAAATEECASAVAMERTANTLYDLLGLSRRDASLEEIKGAYRQLARRYHPDARPEGLTLEECTQRFIEVQEAYEILSDPQRRAMYDFEMLHPASAKSGSRPWRREGGWRRGVSHPWSATDSPWQSPEEEAEMRTAWRAQWGSQLSGLRQRAKAQTKAGSWAARMQQQRQEQEAESA